MCSNLIGLALTLPHVAIHPQAPGGREVEPCLEEPPGEFEPLSFRISHPPLSFDTAKHGTEAKESQLCPSQHSHGPEPQRCSSPPGRTSTCPLRPLAGHCVGRACHLGSLRVGTPHAGCPGCPDAVASVSISSTSRVKEEEVFGPAKEPRALYNSSLL